MQPQAESWVSAVLDAYALSFGSAWNHVSTTKVTDTHVRTARRGVIKLVKWVLGLWGAKSPFKEALLKTKAFANWLRRRAVRDLVEGFDVPDGVPSVSLIFAGALSLKGYGYDEQSRIIHQFSRFGRAGPLPVREQVGESCTVHTADLGRRFEPHTKYAKSMYRYAYRWAYGRVKSMTATFPTSLSSTMFRKVKEGGLLEDMRQASLALKGRLWSVSLESMVKKCTHGILSLSRMINYEGLVKGDLIGDNLFKGFDWDSSDDYSEHSSFVVHGYCFISMALEVMIIRVNPDDLPEIRQVAIEERGMKVRLVTPIIGCLTYISMFLNSILIQALDTDVRVAPSNPNHFEGLEGNPLASGDIWISVDMIRATDLIARSSAKAMSAGLAKGLGLSPFLSEALELCIGDYKMTTLDGLTVNCRSGILMGSGVSWPILCIYNLWLWDTSWKRYDPLDRVRRKKVKVCGDDLLGQAPPAVSKNYTSLLGKTGGGTSKGKYTESYHFGVLVEELIDAKGVVLRTSSVRIIQPASSKEGKKVIPAWALGPQLDLLWKQMGSPRWLLDYIHFRHQGPMRVLNHMGINASLPRCFGGGGYPCLSVAQQLENLCPFWKRSLRVAMSQGEHGLHFQSFSGVWSDRYGAVLDSVQLDIMRSDQSALITSSSRIQEFGDIITLPTLTSDELIQRAISVASATAALSSNVQIRLAVVTPSYLAKRLESVKSHLNSLVPYPALTDPSRDLAAGLIKFREQIIDKPHSTLALLNIVNGMSTRIVGDGNSTLAFG